MEILENLFTIITNLSVIITLIILIRQLKLMENSNYSATFGFVTNHLQDPSIVNARKIILGEVFKNNIKMNEWNDEQIEAAKRICSTYDVVGIAIRNKMLPEQIVADSWGDSLRKTWTVLKPFVEKLRIERNSMEYWDDYEWLAEQSFKYQKPFKKL